MKQMIQEFTYANNNYRVMEDGSFRCVVYCNGCGTVFYVTNKELIKNLQSKAMELFERDLAVNSIQTPPEYQKIIDEHWDELK